MNANRKTSEREEVLREVRRLVRGVGVRKGVSRMRQAELRGEAHRLLTERRAWLTPREQEALRKFICEDIDLNEMVCCDKVYRFVMGS
jgi:hypothetical protein